MTDCHTWIGSRDSRGYGVFVYVIAGIRRATGAHRAMWLATHGDLEAGMQIDHLCRNTICINPEHLEAVTRHENMRRVPRPISYGQGRGTTRHAIRVPDALWADALGEAEERGDSVNGAIRRFLRAYADGRDVELSTDDVA